MVMSRFVNLLSSLRSEISFDINGLPVWGMGLGEIGNPTVTLEEIFTYLNQADKPCLVAIDEFQQITKYNDEKTQITLGKQCFICHKRFAGQRFHHHGQRYLYGIRPVFRPVDERQGVAYILNTPNCCGGKGWFNEAAMPKAKILRVSMGSMMPSSQSRAVL